jgi:hypothetical protein
MSPFAGPTRPVAAIDFSQVLSQGTGGGNTGGNTGGTTSGGAQTTGNTAGSKTLTDSTGTPTNTDTSGQPSQTDDNASSLDPPDEPASKPIDPIAYRKTLATAHAIIGGVVWLIVSPGAVLIARLFRTTYREKARAPTFRIWHEWIHVVLTLTGTITCACLAIAIINSKGGLHFSGTHQVMGMFILFGLTVQVTLGWIIHELKHFGRFLMVPSKMPSAIPAGRHMDDGSWFDHGRPRIQGVGSSCAGGRVAQSGTAQQAPHLPRDLPDRWRLLSMLHRTGPPTEEHGRSAILGPFSR